MDEDPALIIGTLAPDRIVILLKPAEGESPRGVDRCVCCARARARVCVEHVDQRAVCYSSDTLMWDMGFSVLCEDEEEDEGGAKTERVGQTAALTDRRCFTDSFLTTTSLQ
ncbi:hypothetical protein JOB18_009624 [Solea senegalensis]|uniref:Uncharacterized protein n=1 Tax=Solea senegalensis TaxID=28829 RepID=A0AAV6SHN2_SOLSE|nr:hypothetical protein JOB18_009624 [Solea senegalensis]